ncbi:MAG: outer membrane protein transport protein [Holophaga sp.]|nr:outer membrane protein transport protein [Holophaga sp.]
MAFLLAVAGAPQAAASGFQLRDQSGSGQGTAYAGISAGGSDISSMFFNPAAMIRFEGNQLQVGLTEIVPSSKFSASNASYSAGGTIQGSTSTGNIASSATLPTLYGMWTVSPDLRLGLSVNVPFGLTTSYDSGWAGRYQAMKSHLETLDISPSIAYRLDSKWSVGLAIVARRAKAELSQGIDMGSEAATTLTGITPPSGSSHIVNPSSGGFSAGSSDGSVDVRGSSWAYGYKLGVIYEASPKLHLGLGYQSEIRETIKGSATFNVPSSVASSFGAVAAANSSNSWAYGTNGSNGAIGAIASALSTQTASGSASALLVLPATISLGVIYDVSSTLSLALEISDTQWSSFKELRVKFYNSSAQPDSTITENWKDALFVALGATYHPAGKWTYRAGIAKDNSPVPDSTRNPRIPDADRVWVSCGVGYQFTKAFVMDAGYSHLFCKDSTINLQGGSNAGYYQGNLSGTYKNTIDVLALQARYTF